jgi:hypothetical protein
MLAGSFRGGRLADFAENATHFLQQPEAGGMI